MNAHALAKSTPEKPSREMANPASEPITEALRWKLSKGVTPPDSCRQPESQNLSVSRFFGVSDGTFNGGDCRLTFGFLESWRGAEAEVCFMLTLTKGLP